MSDGAHLGANVEQAMKAVLGDTDELKAINAGKREQTPEEFEAYLRANSSEPWTYETSANYIAVKILDYMRAHPDTQDWPTTPGRDAVERNRVGPDIYNLIKDSDPEFKEMVEGRWGPTGFQYGWAANAAKFILGQPPVPNPAIIQISGG